MTENEPQSIEAGGETVAPGEKRQFRYDAATTYHGNSVDIPVTSSTAKRTDPGSSSVSPFTGLVVGVLENAVAYSGHLLCYFVRIDESTADIIRNDIRRGMFDIYREGGFQWRTARVRSTRSRS